MGWYNREYPPNKYIDQSRETSDSDSTINSKPKTTQIKIVQAKTALSPEKITITSPKLSVAERLQGPGNELTIKLTEAIEELKIQKEINLRQKREIFSLKIPPSREKLPRK